jgi:predicted kinase
MTSHRPVLHMICGKIGSGKSTLAATLAQAPHTVLVSQDKWMAALYPNELKTIEDYKRLVPRFYAIMGPHLTDLLRSGLSVVLDFPANTVANRAWMRGIFEAAGAGHRLHVLDPPDEVCWARLQARNAAGQHEYQVSREEFEAFTAYFQQPTPDEGLDVARYP